MAYQSSKAAPRGEDIADPTRAGRPAPQTYRSPISRDDRPAGGAGGYGKNQYGGASSVSVRDSATVADFTASPPDPVRDAIIDGGFGDRSESGAPIDDLRRKVSTEPYPAAHGMQSARARQPSSGGAIKVPDSLGTSEAEPVRQPPKGQGQM